MSRSIKLIVYLCSVSVASSFLQTPTSAVPRIGSCGSQSKEMSSTTLNALKFPTTLLADAAGGASSTMQSVLNSKIFNYFMETVISNGVPAVFTIAVIGFTASQIKSGRKEKEDFGDTALSTLYDDLYGDQKKDQESIKSFLPKPKNKLPKNLGIPEEEFIQITHLNRMYDSYDYSIEAATNSKVAAARNFRRASFERALGKSMANLSASTRQELLEAEKEVLKEAAPFVKTLEDLQRELNDKVSDGVMKQLGLESAYQIDPSKQNVTKANAGSKASQKQMLSDVSSGMTTARMNLVELEANFIARVIEICGPENAASVRTALAGYTGNLLTDPSDRPLSAIFENSGETANRKPRMFVARFPGDTTASQVEELRQEVTAICRQAREGDEALVVLQTGGGTVTGYGLASAQLQRFREAGMKLTIAVEQVAASGGYMMCCVADRIVASPFAVLGSIGVISDIPNVYERLQREGIEFQTVTAGKYKRTLTPTKKPSKQDFEKTKGDVEDILVLFKEYVQKNRPKLDIEKVATGETWFGSDALERNLCDEIKTVDTLFSEYIDEGYDVFEIKYKPPSKPLNGLPLLPASSSGLVERAVAWTARRLASVIQQELDLSMPVERRYMAQDRESEKFTLKD